MTNQFNPAGYGQLSAVGFKIAGTVTRILGDSRKLSFEDANHLVLSPEHEIEKLTEKFCEEIFGIKANQWTEEKKRIEVFYKKFFGRTIDWTKVTLPEKVDAFKRIEYIFADITCNQVFEAYAKKFGKDSVWKAWQSIDQAIKEQQNRPAGDRVIAHIGGLEPDMLNKSYDDGIAESITFMIPIEGMIAAFRERTETGKMYDVKGLTRFAALDSDSDAMSMCRNTLGQFGVSYGNRGSRNAGYGLRQVRF